MEMTTCTGLRSEGTPDAESVADSDCCAKTRPGAKSRKIVSDRQETTCAPCNESPRCDKLPPWTRCLALAFLLLLVSGWVNRQQQAVIDYLLEENRILRAAHAPRRLRLTDDQRRRWP